MKIKKNSVSKSIPNTKYIPPPLTFFEQSIRPVSDTRLQQIAEQMRIWRETEDAYILAQFYTSLGYKYEDMNLFAARYEPLRREIDITKEYLGAKREIGGLTRKLDPGIVTQSMYMYSPAWKEMAEWKAKLARDKEDEGGTKIVVIERFVEEKKK